MSGLQSRGGEGILERKRAADQEPDVVVSPDVEQIVPSGQVFTMTVDAVLGEVGANVEVGALDAGGRVDAVWVSWCRGASKERAGDGIAETEIVEVVGVLGRENQEVGLQVPWSNPGGVGDQIVSTEKPGFMGRQG